MVCRYDIAVVGAGPGGGLAALTAARAGCRTLLIEKHPRIGLPLCCAEAISLTGITDNIVPEPDWIATGIERCYLRSPGGQAIEFDHPDAGYVLNRPIFEQGLADKAAAHGAEIRTGTEVVGLIAGAGGRFTGLRLRHNDLIEDITCEVIIAADGIESMVARWAGLDTTLCLEQMDSAAQFLLGGLPELDPNRLEFYFDTERAPGGYAWVFPKGNGTANVGLALAPHAAGGKKAIRMLNDFIRYRFGATSPRRLGRAVGGIPEFRGRRFMLKSNVLVVGDAARLVDSVTGAGIAGALLSGRFAAETAVSWMRDGRGDHSRLGEYPRRWMAARGREMRYFRWSRNIMLRMTAADFDDVVGFLGQFYNGKTITAIDPIDVIKKGLRHRPSLLRLARHLIW